jgi:hypothetical protein
MPVAWVHMNTPSGGPKKFPTMTEPSPLMPRALELAPPGGTPRSCMPPPATQRKARRPFALLLSPTTMEPSALTP